MGLDSLLVSLMIGALAGSLAGRLVRGGGFGVPGDVLVGFLGATIAGWIFPALGLDTGAGWIGSIVPSTVGATVFLALQRLLDA